MGCFIITNIILSPACGSEADTSIIRQNGSPLGKTNGGGQVDAAAAVAKFMGTGATSRVKRHLLPSKRAHKRSPANGLAGLLGGGGAGKSSGATNAVGVKTPQGTVEDQVESTAGSGADTGLPTVGSDGIISMTMHQV
jgi:hypothetical protein